MLRVRLLAALLVLASCDNGGDDPGTCTPGGDDPMAGCSLDDCRAGHNSCNGTVYACDETGHVIELGTCDLSMPGPFDGGKGQCTPGQDPVIGCSEKDCANGVNNCGGQVFACDMLGEVVVIGVCPTVFVPDAAPPDAAPADASTMPPPIDAGM